MPAGAGCTGRAGRARRLRLPGHGRASGLRGPPVLGRLYYTTVSPRFQSLFARCSGRSAAIAGTLRFPPRSGGNESCFARAAFLMRRQFPVACAPSGGKRCPVFFRRMRKMRILSHDRFRRVAKGKSHKLLPKMVTIWNNCARNLSKTGRKAGLHLKTGKLCREQARMAMLNFPDRCLDSSKQMS